MEKNSVDLQLSRLGRNFPKSSILEGVFVYYGREFESNFAPGVALFEYLTDRKISPNL